MVGNETPSAATDASPVQREQAWLRQRVGAPKEPRLGCSLIAHDRLGFCSACAPRLRDGGPNGDRAELLGWQMLALRQDEVVAATAKRQCVMAGCDRTVEPGQSFYCTVHAVRYGRQGESDV